MNRQLKVSLPPLYRADATSHVVGDLFPRIEDSSVNWHLSILFLAVRKMIRQLTTTARRGDWANQLNSEFEVEGMPRNNLKA